MSQKSTFTALYIIYLIILFLPLTSLFASELSEDEASKTKTPIFHVYDNINLIPTLKIDYGKPRIVARSTYPQLQGESENDDIDVFNTVVTEFVQQKIAEFTNEVIANRVEDAALPRTKIRNDLYVDFATSFVKSGKSPIMSVRFVTQGYITGTAHPYHRHFVLNYDLRNQEELELSALFKPDANYLAVLSDYTKTILMQRLKDKSLVDKGTRPNEENFKNWNIKSNGLLITFDENQVAPYIDGAQTVLIPFSAIKDMIEPTSPIMSCVINKRNCASTNVLTGGFIDEATLPVKNVIGSILPHTKHMPEKNIKISMKTAR